MSLSSPTTYRIAVIPGDGIGREVIPAACRVLKVGADAQGFILDYTTFPWGCEYYTRTGRMMPDDGIIHTMPYWDERFAALAQAYPGVEIDQYHIDILSALGPAVVGGLGIAAAIRAHWP